MNCFGVSIFVNLLLFSILSVHLTSSASFPNPPQKPPSNASPDEQALFWKLLHNYYAIIARPRFGKRSESFVKHPSYLETGHFDSAPSASSEYDMDRFNHPINVDSVYTFENSDKKRRRRR
ncbi:unnamed protein product [Adineta ricciae]|uniref:Uncharacterized protein n=1 Tax=Adineta ricciae TaxID=249248 RepID=A0A815A407_ADIRI|nr:unnamed protein product [Adineta ricciae]